MNETREVLLIKLKYTKRDMKEKSKKIINVGTLVILLLSLIVSTTGCSNIFGMIAGRDSKLQAPEITSVVNADGSSQVSITNLNKTGEIYYTLDGAEPLTNSLLYKNSFTVNQTTTVNTRVIDRNELSSVTTQQFNITQVTTTAAATTGQTQTTSTSIPSIKGLGVEVSSLFDVWASSTLSPINGIYYNVSNLTDYDSSTAWVEGASGNGYGETVSFSYKGSQTAQIQGVEIVNGYAKSSTSFYDNGCVTQLGVKINGKNVKSLNLSATTSPQYLDLNCTVAPGDVIVFEINGVQEGPNDGEYDTAMSKLSFY